MIDQSREARPYSLNGQTTSSPAALFGYQNFTHLGYKLPIFQNVFQLSEPMSIERSDLGFSRGLVVRDAAGHVLQIIQR